MNDVERLHRDLGERFPDRSVAIDPAETKTGSWFVDVPRDGGLPPVVVEWRPGYGFGLSTPTADDFGVGVDESYPDARATFDRVVRLVLSGNPSVAPSAVRLGELRRIAGLTQSVLAARLGIEQACVSRMENRQDIQLTTMIRYVEAIGAKLSVWAILPDGKSVELAVPGSMMAVAGVEVGTDVAVN